MGSDGRHPSLYNHPDYTNKHSRQSNKNKNNLLFHVDSHGKKFSNVFNVAAWCNTSENNSVTVAPPPLSPVLIKLKPIQIIN